jgi:hypothetical protein
MKINVCNIFKTCTFALAGFAAILFMSQPAFAEEVIDDEWKFSAKFNLWAPDIENETAGGTRVKIGIDDIIEDLDFTYMGNFVAKKNNWVFATDVVYLHLDHSTNTNLINHPPLRLDLTDVEMTSWIVTSLVGYNVVDTDRVNLNLMAGARYLYLKVDTEVRKQILATTTEGSTSVSGNAWDGIVAARGEIDLTEGWYLPFYVDVGTGESRLTWQAYTAVGYKFDNVALSVGYRHLEWDFDDDDDFGETFNWLTVSGPMVGIKYMF